MYKVIMNNRPAKTICETLRQLSSNSEVNVHVGEFTYYNAQFKRVNVKNGTATFVIDRFYKNGNQLITLPCKKITSIDFPLSSNLRSSSDNEDE